MNSTLLHEQIAKWREEADLFARRGLTKEAAMARSFAFDLEETI